ncbi:hypothetical protein [Paenibacillus koleovorans]|uniref:hypothetical protein n=1 Tax=Paenibacillus koleovorans TaxID=121608 RepID=UPI000FD98EA4|nr:hypothetical protein [Paenibacillus koleovorans]
MDIDNQAQAALRSGIGSKLIKIAIVIASIGLIYGCVHFFLALAEKHRAEQEKLGQLIASLNAEKLVLDRLESELFTQNKAMSGLKTEIDALKKEITAFESKPVPGAAANTKYKNDVDAYNKLADQYNAQSSTYNLKYKEYSSQIEAYNAKVNEANGLSKGSGSTRTVVAN